MALIDTFLQELEMEARTTRRVLESVPEGQLGWRPHPRSFSLGQLALHIASSIGLVSHMLTLDSMELPSFQQPEALGRKQILDALDASLKAANEILPRFDDAKLMTALSFTKNGAPVMQMPKIAVIRSILLNHQYHHRGQLTVYLRLLSVPVPSVYGPSADEAMMM